MNKLSPVVAIIALSAAACSGGAEPRGLEIAVTPLTLPGITNACYDLTVTNGLGATVWSRTQVCSTQYGDGEGAITYIGTCDASPGAEQTTVALTLTSLSTGVPAAPLPVDSYANPCPAGAPCTQTAVCKENADVKITFDIAIMRDAKQGFFDIAVNFDDVFCSAKFDCAAADLLFNPFVQPVARDTTAVLGFACTAGAQQPTFMHMSDVVITCDGGATTITLNPNDPAGPGNLGPRNASGDFVYEHATYYGDEFPGNTAGIEKCYWNMAIGLWEDRLAGHTGCTLTARATASSQQLVAGTTPANTVWPVVTFTIPLTLDENNRLACGSNAMDAVGSGVTTDYSPITGAQFAHFLECATVTPGDHPIDDPTDPPDPVTTECPTAPGTVRLAQSGANLTMTFGAASAAFVLPGATAATVAGCCAETCCQSTGE